MYYIFVFKRNFKSFLTIMILPIVKCFLLIWVFFLRETLKSLKFKTKYTNFIRQSKVYSIHYFCLHCFLLIAKSCPTLCNPMDCSPPASSAHGFSQARILSGFSFLDPIFFFFTLDITNRDSKAIGRGYICRCL